MARPCPVALSLRPPPHGTVPIRRAAPPRRQARPAAGLIRFPLTTIVSEVCLVPDDCLVADSSPAGPLLFPHVTDS